MVLRLQLSGKTVLDIGTWDGYFAFKAESLGAAGVTALDHYVWSLDILAQQLYWKSCRSAGLPPEEYHLVPACGFRKHSQAKKGFDTARSILHSKVKPVVGDFITMDLATPGQFDVVLFRGVLYHMNEPATSS
jgi:tRNA (mo5U34)-methyltransferase